MKCQVTSSTTHGVLISKEIPYKSFKEICSGEKKKVNVGYINEGVTMFVVNDTITDMPARDFIHAAKRSELSHDWEVLKTFFSIHLLEPTLSQCSMPGNYDEDLGGWTGCMGQVCGTQYRM